MLVNQTQTTGNTARKKCRERLLLNDAYWKIKRPKYPWADVLNRANLGMEVMHERNAHNFPLDLAAAETTEVALVAPAIG